MEIARVFVALILVSNLSNLRGETKVSNLEACEFPAIYNFGDSNSDTGGIAAAFYQMSSPSGETFFHQPVGRASDGRLIIDFIAKHLKLQYLSAYLNALGTSFSHGANFATGGATIRRQNESWFENGVSPFPLEIQIAQFTQFKVRTTNLYEQAKEHNHHRHNLPKPEDFSKALYTFDIGQNDVAASIRKMNYQQFVAVIPDIIEQLAAAIQNLYNQGGRAFWIHNTGPIGCLAVTLHYLHNPAEGYVDKYGCVKDQNAMAIEFNRQLKNRVSLLRSQLSDAVLTYVDVFAAKLKLISNAKDQGRSDSGIGITHYYILGYARIGEDLIRLVTSNKDETYPTTIFAWRFLEKETICCGYHEDNTHIWCGNKGIVNGTEIYAGSCKDPSKVISWDGVHYTESANHWIATRILNGSFSDPPLIPITHSCPTF